MRGGPSWARRIVRVNSHTPLTSSATGIIAFRKTAKFSPRLALSISLASSGAWNWSGVPFFRRQTGNDVEVETRCLRRSPVAKRSATEQFLFGVIRSAPGRFRICISRYMAIRSGRSAELWAVCTYSVSTGPVNTGMIAFCANTALLPGCASLLIVSDPLLAVASGFDIFVIGRFHDKTRPASSAIAALGSLQRTAAPFRIWCSAISRQLRPPDGHQLKTGSFGPYQRQSVP